VSACSSEREESGEFGDLVASCRVSFSAENMPNYSSRSFTNPPMELLTFFSMP